MSGTHDLDNASPATVESNFIHELALRKLDDLGREPTAAEYADAVEQALAEHPDAAELSKPVDRKNAAVADKLARAANLDERAQQILRDQRVHESTHQQYLDALRQAEQEVSGRP